MTGSGAVLVLPTTTVGQQGPVAAMLSTAGWAAAARRVLGEAWIVTPSGIVSPEEARQRGSAAHLASPTSTSWKRWVPTVAKTAAKDVRQARRGRDFDVSADGPWGSTPLAFVWQRHELFHAPGIDLAARLGVPSVLFVPATPVWESAQWGVHRPGWARLAERQGERPALRAADLVACGSDAVAEQVVRLGAREDRILITPTGVDLDLFPAGDDVHLEPANQGSAVRQQYGLAGRFVVGWVGSFRRFHALELAVEALVGIDDATLLLVGDGPERSRIEQQARSLGVAVVASGTVDHAALPAHLAAMDVAVVTAPATGSFHYSPLKVAEYLAAGRAVVAPAVPQLADRLRHDVDALLVPPGDAPALTTALRRLRDEPDTRSRLGIAARAAAEAEWSWDRQVERVTAHLASAHHP